VPGSGTLIAVVMREQHPIDLSDSGVCEVIEDRSAATVNDQAAVAVAKYVDVAGVLEAVEVGRDFLQRSHAISLPVARIEQVSLPAEKTPPA
jgi:hypothetical protein